MLMPKKKTRAAYVMVAEDDPQWARFWDAYPHRVSKKEARKAWALISPSPELVDRMLRALAWQVPLWAKQGYGTPYPASWLHADRWDDEPPASVRPVPGVTWNCLHLERCANRQMCQQASILGRPVRVLMESRS